MVLQEKGGVYTLTAKDRLVNRQIERVRDQLRAGKISQAEADEKIEHYLSIKHGGKGVRKAQTKK